MNQLTNLQYNDPSTILDTLISKIDADGGLMHYNLFRNEYQNLHHLIKRGASMIVCGGAYKTGTVYGYAPQSGNLIPFTYTRADSVGTRVNSQGLIEPACYNLFQYSEQLDNGVWIKANCTITANTTAAPDGTVTADKLVESNTNSSHELSQSLGALVTGQVITVSFHAKAGERQYVRLSSNSSVMGGNDIAVYDLVGGKITNLGSNGTASITLISNGWYRCTRTWTVVTTGTANAYWAPSPNSNAIRGEAYLGDGTSGVYVWGTQFVQGSDPRDYLKTTDRLNVPRMDYDPATGQFKGLLMERASTNLITWSEDLSNATAWVKGGAGTSITVTNAGTVDQKIAKAATSDFGFVREATSALSISTVYTFSTFAKKDNYRYIGLRFAPATRNDAVAGNVHATFDFDTETFSNLGTHYTGSFQRFGNGLYRLIVTATTNAGPDTYYFGVAIVNSSGQENWDSTGFGVLSVYTTKAQFEQGTPTSYIPTTTVTVTRAEDVCNTSSISWYNQNEGTMFGDHYMPVFQNAFLQTLCGVDNGANTMGIRTGNNGYGIRIDGNSVIAGAPGPTYNGQRSRVAVGLKDNDIAASATGQALGSSTSLTIPKSITTFTIGKMISFTDADCAIRTIAYFPNRLVNNDLQALTV